MPAESAERPAGAPAQRRGSTRSGRVVSCKMDKTVVVVIERLVQHAAYKRVVKRTTKLYAHDEKNRCKVGDIVTVAETRPLSKLKRWRVRAILREGKPYVGALPDAEAVVDTGRPIRKRRAEAAPATDDAEGGAP